jgi:type VI secretion system secreted protein Hcp
MAVDYFLKVDGVEGDSIVKSKEGWAQLLAWSWGMSQTGTTHHGSGGGAGKVNVQDMSFTKHVDKSSPVLISACCTGKHFDKATLVCRKAGDSPLEFLTIEMTNCIITSVSSGGSGGEDLQTENITLNFAAFTVSYQGQDEKGAKKGGAVKVNYHIAKNEV